MVNGKKVVPKVVSERQRNRNIARSLFRLDKTAQKLVDKNILWQAVSERDIDAVRIVFHYLDPDVLSPTF